MDSTGPSHQLIQRLFDAIVDGRFDADAQQLVRSTKHVHVLFTILLPKLPLAFQVLLIVSSEWQSIPTPVDPSFAVVLSWFTTIHSCKCIDNRSFGFNASVGRVFNIDVSC